MKNRAGKAVSSYGLILVIVMLISSLSPALIAARATTTMVSIPEMTKPAGSYATLPLTIHGVQNYGTGTISITYNPSVVHVTGAAGGPESTVTSWNVDNTTGIVRISAWNIAGVSGDLVFANIDFKLVGSADSSTPLNLAITTLKDTGYNDIPATVNNGSFSIESEEEAVPWEGYLVPQDSTGNYGEDTPVEFWVKYNDTGLTCGAVAYQFDLHFEPGCVNITSADFSTSPFGSHMFTPYAPGVVRILEDNYNTMTPLSAGTYKMATLTLHGESSTPCTCDVWFDPSWCIVSDTDGEPITNTYMNGTYTNILGGSISGKVTYTCNTTGIAGATVNLKQDGSVINSTTTDGDGNYTFIEVTPGVYSVNASKPRFWDNATDVTVTAGAPTEANLMLWLKGDVYNDGGLDIYDIIMLRQAAAENIPWDYRYDVYVDDVVDIYDIIVLRQAVAGNIVLE
jgi:hypothetical protein